MTRPVSLLLCLFALAACTTPIQGVGLLTDVSAVQDTGTQLDTPPHDVVLKELAATPDSATPADALPDTPAPQDVATVDSVPDPGGSPDDAADDVVDATGGDVDDATTSEIAGDVGPAVCDDSAKRCDHAFSYTGDGSETVVELRGSFNAWKKGIPLVQGASGWSVVAQMPYNTSVQYKFRTVGTGGVEKWLADPGNPDSADDGYGGKNSVLAADACDPWTCVGPQTVCGVPAKPGAFDWRDGVMYFVFVDRFANGNPANDNKNKTAGLADIANWNGGDWQGVTQKIESGWFTDLGVNVLWVTVPMDNTDAAEVGADGKLYAAYHGYWPRDTSKPEAHFGTMDDLKALVDAAHAKGIQIVLDYAMNHVHKSSPIYQAHAGDGWFHPAQVNGQDCVCGSSVCPWNGPTMVTCWFQTYLPDFNFANVDAQNASLDNVIWWMKQSGADGLRLDAIKHVEGSWLTGVRQRLLDEIEPGKQQHVWLVGETFDGDKGFIKSFVDPCAKLDGQFDFPLRAQLLTNVLLGQGKMTDLKGFLDANDGYYGPDAIMSTFVGNHDLPRAIHFAQDQPGWTDVWSDGKDKSWVNQPGVVAEKSAYERLGLAMAVLMTTPGVPLIYYGDEVGMPGAGDPDNRRPMQWGGYNIGQSWLLARMQALGQARAKYPALRRGVRSTLSVTDDTWVYQMATDTQTVYVALNRGSQPAPVTGLPDAALTDALTGEVVQGATATVPARGVRVLPQP